MNYSNALAVCLSLILSDIVGESATLDVYRRINNAGIDFRSHTRSINATNKMLSTADQPNTWIWKPLGQERNSISSEAILHLFKDDSSGFKEEEPGSGHDYKVYEEPKENKTTREEIWTFSSNETSIEAKTMRTPKTLDSKRNETAENMHLTYQSHLRMSNWCFKDNEETTANHKLKRTEWCCRRRRECQSRRHVKGGIYDCSCDIYFHVCLKNTPTKMAESIIKMYFNRNIVCYKKLYKACKNEPCIEDSPSYEWRIIPQHHK